MQEVTRKIWDKHRPSLVEKTGIGKAIEEFHKECPDSPSKLDDFKTVEDFKKLDLRIKNLRSALNEGLRQLKEKAGDKKAKPEEFKKATTLLEGWQKLLKEYSEGADAQQAIVYKMAMDGAQGQVEGNENLVKAEREFYNIVKVSLEDAIKKLQTQCKIARDAAEKGEQQKATMAIAQARKAFSDADNNGSKSGLLRLRETTAKNFKVNAKDIKMPSFSNALYKKALEYEDEVGEVLALVDQLVEKSALGVDENKVKGPNPEYEKALKEAISLYKSINTTLKEAVGLAKRIAAHARQLGEKVEKDQKTPAATYIKIIQVMNQKHLEVAQLAVDKLDESRNNDTPIRKKLKQVGLTDKDSAECLKPLMDLAFQINNSVVSASNVVNRNVRAALLHLIDTRPNDNAEAVKELQRLDNREYVPKNKLGER